MNSLYKRKLNKIYKKINKISSEGKDNILEYYKYLNELVEKGDYSVLEEVVNLYYNVDITKYPTIQEFRDKLWDEICLQTNSPISVRISKLYKSRGIYQQSNYIFKESDYDVDLNGNMIPEGEIFESERSTNDIDYLIKNKMYARLVGERVPFLEVIDKNGNSLLVDEYDFNLNPEQNQLNQYKRALDFLLN